MPAPKLNNEDVKKIQKLLQQGYKSRELAKRYGVHVSVIYRRAKHPYNAKFIPVETKNKIIKKIKEGYTKAEAAQIYGVPVNTVLCFTKGLPGYKSAGNHIIRKNGIHLLNRLMNDGYLISDFVVSTVRELQKKFPVIRSARYKDKTFFYLPGREEETVEAFFREKPDRVISYYAIEELSYLLGVKFSRKNTMTLVRKYKGKHNQYWQSRRLIQRSIFDWVDDNPFKEEVEPSFRLFPKKGEW